MHIEVPTVVRIKADAINRLGLYLKRSGFNKISLFWGEGLKEKFGENIGKLLEENEITILFEAIPVSQNIEDIFRESLNIPDKTNAIVAIGGGRVIDFCKYISFILKKEFVSVPTVISNDGFSSPMSSLIVKEKRKTVKTIVPHAVIIDISVIKKAPIKFLYSGMGDIISKNTALFDWKLAFKKTNETVNDFAATIAQNSLDSFVYYDNRDINNSEYIKVIARSLLMSGLAMNVAGSTRPASGSEHLISHAYDFIAQKPDMHGIQVGIASYAVSYLQEETYALTKKIIEDSGFLKFVSSSSRLNRTDFISAIKKAPTIKESFYTILSETENIEKLINFVKQDEIMQSMLSS